MASRVRQEIEKPTNIQEFTCSSGVKILVRPIPADLWKRLAAKLEKDYPYPLPPKKTVPVLDGTETIDDLNNEDYLADKRAIDASRFTEQAEAVLDFCVEIAGGLAQYELTIARIEKRMGEKYPTDLDEKRMLFLSEYAIRNPADWQLVFSSAIEQTQITDSEVSKRMDSFRDNVAQPKANGVTPSSLDESVGMELQPTV